MAAKILSQQEVAELMESQGPSADLKDSVNEVIARYLKIAEDKFSKNFIFPDVVYDLKGQAAGMACHHPKEHPEYFIRLNHDLLINSETSRDMFEQTIPHEVAHIVVQQMFPRSAAHGGHWVWVMTMFNKPAKRCHNYDVKPARVHSRVPYYCECEPPDNVHNITVRMRDTIELDGKKYRCRRCRQILTSDPR